MKSPVNNATVLQRHGATMLETLVALTLLTTVMSVSVPLVVRHAQLLTSQREYRLALDELTNQLERLIALPHGELAQAVAQLQPSENAVTGLHGAKLTAELHPAELGERLTLRITWDEPQRAKSPVVLSTWIFPAPRVAAGQLLPEASR